MASSTRKTTHSIFIATLSLACLAAAFVQPALISAQAQKPRLAVIQESDLKEWLTYLSSDELQGRQIFTEGYGLAAAYVADHLRQWGVKPLGDNGSYFGAVKRRGYRVTRNSSVTVEVNGQSKTFKHGDHVTFATNAGGRQTLTYSGVEFAGYAIVSQQYTHDDFAGRDVKGKLVVYLNGTPAAITQAIAAAQAAQPGGRGGRGGLGGNRANYALQTLGAAAIMGFAPAPAPPTPAEDALTKAQAALAQANDAVVQAQQALIQAQRGGAAGRGAAPGGRGAGGGRGATAATPADFTSVQRIDLPVPPQITADETFYDFLFSAAPTKFADLRAKAEKGEPLPPATLAGVKVTINIDNQYDVISTELSRNVIGMVEGSDPKLKDTYVVFGAHLDHVGYRTAAGAGRGGGRGAAPAAGGAEPDLISNGADDDGSGSTGELGIAKAFATGPKPKRSLVFIWHSGEEAGLLGSRYHADFPLIPLDKVQCQLNIDMIGRNRDNDPTQANSVFVIGADRISTDLHNMVVDSNAKLAHPVTLDYEYNDPSDPNSFYTRSDHYSYAVKGIPIAFFFTGTHPDYHQVTDSVEKILFPKMARIAQLVYETGFAIANTDKVLERDNKGPRSGKGFSGRIEK